MKNKILKDHFLNPRNIAPIENPTISTIKKSEICNDIVKLAVEIDQNETIHNISIEVYGCGYSIAGASLFSEAVKGAKLIDVEEIAGNAVKEIINEIPEKSKYCLTLSHRAFEKLFLKYKEGDVTQ